MISSAIEFHDSVIDAIFQRGDDVIVSFAHAYIHKSEGRPGWDAGTGWVQAAELTFVNGSLPRVLTELPDDIGHGDLRLSQRLLNMVPIPLEYTGEAELSVTLIGSGEQISVRGTGVRLQLLGEAQYVEEFPG